MITGEERIRELLGQLYGTVTGYDGKPTDYQAARTESLGHELQDVIDEISEIDAERIAGNQRRPEEEKTAIHSSNGRSRLAEEEGPSLRSLPVRECERAKVRCEKWIEPGKVWGRLANGHLGLFLRQLQLDLLVDASSFAMRNFRICPARAASVRRRWWLFTFPSRLPALNPGTTDRASLRAGVRLRRYGIFLGAFSRRDRWSRPCGKVTRIPSPSFHASTAIRHLDMRHDQVAFLVFGDIFVQAAGNQCFMLSRNCRFAVSTASTCALTNCPTFTTSCGC